MNQEALTLAVEGAFIQSAHILNNFMISDSSQVVENRKCLPIEVEDRFPSFNLNGPEGRFDCRISLQEVKRFVLDNRLEDR
jgi:hypothetical protein